MEYSQSLDRKHNEEIKVFGIDWDLTVQSELKRNLERKHNDKKRGIFKYQWYSLQCGPIWNFRRARAPFIRTPNPTNFRLQFEKARATSLAKSYTYLLVLVVKRKCAIFFDDATLCDKSFAKSSLQNLHVVPFQATMLFSDFAHLFLSEQHPGICNALRHSSLQLLRGGGGFGGP